MTASRLELLIGSLTAGIDVFAKGTDGGVDEREVAMSAAKSAKVGGGEDVEMN